MSVSPGPCPERGPLVPSRSLMRLDELALRDMIWAVLRSPPPLLLRLFSFFVLLPSSSPCSFFLKRVTGIWWPKKMPEASPWLSPWSAWPLLYFLHAHTNAHTYVIYTKWNTFPFPPSPFPHTRSGTCRLTCTSPRIQLQLMLLQLSTWEVLGFL